MNSQDDHKKSKENLYEELYENLFSKTSLVHCILNYYIYS